MCGNEKDEFVLVGDHYLCHGEIRSCYRILTEWLRVPEDRLVEVIERDRDRHGLTRHPIDRLLSRPSPFGDDPGMLRR